MLKRFAVFFDAALHLIMSVHGFSWRSEHGASRAAIVYPYSQP